MQIFKIIVPLVNETSVWCNSFVLVTKLNCKVQMCLDPVRLIKVLIKPVHRGQTFNDILHKLAGVMNLSLIASSLDYHNMKVDEQCPHLTTSCCPFGRCRYARLLFGKTSTGDMFQRKIDELFNGLPNAIGISDDILIAGFN